MDTKTFRKNGFKISDCLKILYFINNYPIKHMKNNN